MTTVTNKGTEKWEANGRTYVDGIDVGPAGTKVDTSNSVALVNNAIKANNDGIKNTINKEKARRQSEYTAGDSFSAYADYQKQMKQQELQKARAKALSSLNAEEQATNQAYANQIKQTGTNSDIALKNYFENVANRGQTYSGSTAQGELAHNIAKQNNISALQTAQANALADIARRRQLAEQGYIDDLQSATNAIDLEVLKNRMEQEQNAGTEALKKAQLMAELGDYTGLQALGFDTTYMQDKQKAAQEKELIERLLKAKDYNALKELGIDVSNLQAEFDSGIAKAKADIANTQSLISSRNNTGSSGTTGSSAGTKTGSGYKSTDASIANYVNRALGKDLIQYNSTTKTYELASEIENPKSTTKDGEMPDMLSSKQVYDWYKDPIIQKVLMGVYNGTISSAEGTNFLRSIGYGDSDIIRVKNYTFQQEGE